MLKQQRLFEFRMGELDPATHVVAESNRDAWTLLQRWRSWPGGAAVVRGPSGSGRSHLARAWAHAVHAAEWTGDRDAAEAFVAAEGRIVVDDAHRIEDEAGIIRLFDLARTRGGAVLLIGPSALEAWPVRAPDLRSRLSAALRADLHEPDEVLLGVVLRRLCRDRFIQLTDDAVQYLCARMERSFEAARALADAMDRGLVAGARPVTVAAARRALLEVDACRAGDGEEEDDEETAAR
jgi:chromosomal replication initiation ATPase DnaA